MGAGRPRLTINWDSFEEMCSIQCTAGEIASCLRISVDTLTRHVEKHYGTKFAETYKKYTEGGKASLRRMQFKLAKTQVGMAIWLGKQYLNQRDNVSLTQASPEIVKCFNDVMQQISREQKALANAEDAEVVSKT